MKISRVGLSVCAFVAMVTMALPAAAQYSGDRGGGAKQPQSQQAAPKQPQGKATCVASGFAKLKRNCTADTGGCQRMPDSCSNGWCCP